jgi:hypothetical protein
MSGTWAVKGECAHAWSNSSFENLPEIRTTKLLSRTWLYTCLITPQMAAMALSTSRLLNPTPSTCSLCGKKAGKSCSRCEAPYCSTACQVQDWRQQGGHKEKCKVIQVAVIPNYVLALFGAREVCESSEVFHLMRWTRDGVERLAECGLITLQQIRDAVNDSLQGKTLQQGDIYNLLKDTLKLDV